MGKRSDNAQRMRPAGGRHARSAVRHRCQIAAVVPGSRNRMGVLWARHVPFCGDYLSDRRSHRAPAHSLDERHQDLIGDRGGQLTGRQ